MESVKVVHTLEEFTKFIEENYLEQDDVLFRGQQRDWPLLPALARERLTGEGVLATERSMLEEFQRCSLPYLRVTPATTWEWVALAQHHGLPTRLLDWSQNPLTSLWFAVNRPPDGGYNGVLWILRFTEKDFPKEVEKKTLECQRHIVLAPKHVTERITAQSAWFTVHQCWSGEPQFEPLEKSAQVGQRLTKVVIPADRFAHLRFHLDRYGVNHASVFPGLDGLSAHIKWKRTFYEDESPLPPEDDE